MVFYFLLKSLGSIPEAAIRESARIFRGARRGDFSLVQPCGNSPAPGLFRRLIALGFGDVERCAPRSGNVHSADNWHAVLEPVVARYRGIVKRLYFRGDAAFANPEMYEFLEAEGMGYAIRLPANRVLQDRIGYLLKRPVGRPPHEVCRFYASFSYRAQSWSKPRRVAAKVEWHHGEL